jgi:regulatory protein
MFGSNNLGTKNYTIRPSTAAGGKVSAIKTQVRANSRYNVFIDSKFAFAISANLLLEDRIVKGLELSDQQVMDYRQKNESDKLYQKAVDRCLARPRSRKETSDYLSQKTDKNTVETLLERLELAKYIDQESFAAWWLSRSVSAKKSTRKLEQELMIKGLKKNEFEHLMLIDPVAQSELLTAIIEKKSKLSRYQDLNRLTRYLLGQGYNYQDIKQALSKKD